MPLMTAQDVGTAVAALGALGTASAGLVDSLKSFRWPLFFRRQGGLSNAGFQIIEQALDGFLAPDRQANPDHRRGLEHNPLRDQIYATAHGNWINGKPLADQTAATRSLIKLQLVATVAGSASLVETTAPAQATARDALPAQTVVGTLAMPAQLARVAPELVDRYARLTGVSVAALVVVSRKVVAGSALDPTEKTVDEQFEALLGAILEEAYQHADQCYRNTAKVAASVVSVTLAVAGGFVYAGAAFELKGLLEAILAGLVATPLAPVAKDLSSALTAGVKLAQALRT